MVVVDMNLAQNDGEKQIVNNGGRRKSKRSDTTQKKFKQPKRGMGVEQLEKLRKQTESSSLYHIQHPSFNTIANVPGAVHFRPGYVPAPTPAMFVHGANLYCTDPSVIGSSNGGFRFENSKEFSSVSNYMKCASDGCAVCQKKKVFNGGGNHFSVAPLHSFRGKYHTGGKTHRSSQVTEVMSSHRNGGSSLTEYEFFPGNGGGAGADEYKRVMMMRMRSPVTTTTATTWCDSGNTSVAGPLGLRCGEGSCVTAITGSEEGSVSSLDLSLKLSY